MKLFVRAFSRCPLGHQCETILHRLESSGILVGPKMCLMSRSDRRDLSRSEVLAEARVSRNDRLELSASSGSVALGWMYGPAAHKFSQSIVGELEIDLERMDEFARVFFQMSREAGAFFAVCDLQSCLRRDLDLWSRQGDVTKRLIRPYWLTYLGLEYAGEVPVEELRSLGARVAETEGGGSEVQLPFGASGVDEDTRVAVGLAWPVFVAAKPSAAFQRTIKVDLSAFQELEQPFPREMGIEGVIGNVREFLEAVQERRTRGVEWARRKGISVNDPRDVILAARRFEAVVRDEREVLGDLAAAFGEMVREKVDGKWSIGRAVYRGEPIVRFGFLGLRATPVVRVFLAALSGD